MWVAAGVVAMGTTIGTGVGAIIIIITAAVIVMLATVTTNVLLLMVHLRLRVVL